MADDKKWYLPSGVCVEDTLHACFKDVSEECAVHSWVINTRDDCVEACFTHDDWKVICDAIPLLPNPEEKLVRSMERFMGVSEDSTSLISCANFLSSKPRRSFKIIWIKLRRSDLLNYSILVPTIVSAGDGSIP